jgi:hypothetical protein
VSPKRVGASGSRAGEVSVGTGRRRYTWRTRGTGAASGTTDRGKGRQGGAQRDTEAAGAARDAANGAGRGAGAPWNLRKRKNINGWRNHRVSEYGLHLGIKRRNKGGGEREIRLVEHDMARDEDLARGKVVAGVPLVFRGVTEKDTTCRPGCQLMRSSGSDVLVTGTPEDTKVIVTRRGTE